MANDDDRLPRVTVILDETLLAEVDALAKEQGMSRNAWMTTAIEAMARRSRHEVGLKVIALAQKLLAALSPP